MIVLTDSVDAASSLLPPDVIQRLVPAQPPDPAIAPVAGALLGGASPVHSAVMALPTWSYLIARGTSPDSQCDRLLELLRAGHTVPDRLACVAGSGARFHGFKGRPWSAVPGNLHLAVHVSPGCEIERFEVAFTVLAALSTIDALDQVPGLRCRAGIRWVNDIVVDDAKLGGVLAYTQTRERVVTSAILGIGLNVEVTPTVEPTPFVSAVSCVRDVVSGDVAVTQRAMLERLLDALQRNYGLLLQAGYRPLLERYRDRSTIIGLECTVCTDESDMECEVIAAGRVSAIGDGLELRFEGDAGPVTRGRLMVGPRRTKGAAEGYGASRMPCAAAALSNDQGSRVPSPARSGPRGVEDGDA